MSSSEDRLHLELMKTTIGTINAYCRVLDLHIKAVEQGANPLMTGQMGDTVQMASTGLKREVEFLGFLRDGATAEVAPTGSQDEP